MSKKDDKSPTHEQNQASLVDALESIRGLLEKSESKLNAARQSIKRANQQNEEKFAMNDSDEIVPILDDIYEPEGKVDSVFKTPDVVEAASPDITDNFELNDIQQIPQSDVTPDLSPAPQSDVTPDLSPATSKKLSKARQQHALPDELDKFQQELEQTLRETLMRTMVKLESDLKQQIKKRINKIKKTLGAD